MNYQKIYDLLIEKRRTNPIIDSYSEKHHIIPKSLGGSNKKENIIRLTAREHFIAHMLLVRIYPKGSLERGKMLWALKRMRYGNKQQQELKNSSRLYEYHRKEFSQVVSKMFKGRKHSTEHRKRISLSKTGKKRSDIETYRRVSLDLWQRKEYVDKQLLARVDRKLSETHKENIGNSLRDKSRSEETKRKIKETKAKNRLLDPENHDRHKQCVYCGIKTNAGNLARHHNDKCKVKKVFDF